MIFTEAIEKISCWEQNMIIEKKKKKKKKKKKQDDYHADKPL
jgi:hypothetical protein